MAEVKEKKSKTVLVRAKLPPFVDLVKDKVVGDEFQAVEWHPWLQAQIDRGLLIEEK